MAHSAEFLLEFDPERFIRMGLTDEDFITLGFTGAELDIIGMRRLVDSHVCADPEEVHTFDWFAYRRYVEESMGYEASRQQQKPTPSCDVASLRVSEPLCFMEIEPSLVDKMIREMHPQWLENGTDFRYQKAKAILWDSGVVTVSNITLIRCVGDNPLVHQTMTLTNGFLRYYLTGDIKVVTPWDVPETRTADSVSELPGIDVVLGNTLTTPEVTVIGIVAELARRSGLTIDPFVFSVCTEGDDKYLQLASPSPIGGRIAIKS